MEIRRFKLTIFTKIKKQFKITHSSHIISSGFGYCPKMNIPVIRIFVKISAASSGLLNPFFLLSYRATIHIRENVKTKNKNIIRKYTMS